MIGDLFYCRLQIGNCRLACNFGGDEKLPSRASVMAAADRSVLGSVEKELRHRRTAVLSRERMQFRVDEFQRSVKRSHAAR